MITKCLFPAAGYGTRFLPAAKAVPKEMFPILNVPLMQYAVSEALNAGVTDMGIITNKYKKAIEDHFDYNNDIYDKVRGTNEESLLEDTFNVINSANFSYIRQKESKGLGDAILTGRPLIGNNATAVILADDLCVNENGNNVLKQMIDLYAIHQCSIVAVEEIEPKDISKYGVIAGDLIADNLYQVHNMVEKPKPKDAPSNLGIIGRYILTEDIFEILKNTQPGKDGDVQITDALMTQAKEGRVLAYKFTGKRFDCGNIDGFVNATNYFYNKL